MAFDFDWLYCWVRKQLARIQSEIDVIAPGSDDWLLEATQSEGFQPLVITRDGDGVVISATVQWSDGSSGVLTTLVKNGEFLTVDSYSVTYDGTLAKTLTQPLVTRDANGAVITKPLIIIS